MMNQHEIIYKNQANWQALCAQSQSPIHIDPKSALPMEDLGDIQIYNHIELINIEKTELTIFSSARAKTTINGRIFHLLQFHFHSPAEHLINNQRYDMELHFVHQSQSGRLAVFAILMTIGQLNPTFDHILNMAENHSVSDATSLLINSLVPKNKSYYHYLGSLTTPPLTENVEWYVFEEPISISDAQLKRFRQMYHGTARDVQPLNNRPVLYNQNCCN